MKRHHSLDFVVGLFVLAGILAFLLLSLKVSGLQDFSSIVGKGDSFVLKANFANIGGLKPRSRVTIGGVNVGRITNITLDQQADSYDAIVEMSLDKSLKNKIPDDSSAGIRTAGLIGDNYVAISPGASETYLKQGETITDTDSALVLEDLIGKFLVSKTTGGDDASPESDKSNNSKDSKDSKDVKEKNEDKS